MDTIFDFVEPFRDFLTILNRNGIRTADWRYFEAYGEFLRLRTETRRTYYDCIEEVAARYGIPVGTMRKKVKTFSSRLRK